MPLTRKWRRRSRAARHPAGCIARGRPWRGGTTKHDTTAGGRSSCGGGVGHPRPPYKRGGARRVRTQPPTSSVARPPATLTHATPKQPTTTGGASRQRPTPRGRGDTTVAQRKKQGGASGRPAWCSRRPPRAAATAPTADQSAARRRGRRRVRTATATATAVTTATARRRQRQRHTPRSKPPTAATSERERRRTGRGRARGTPSQVGRGR